MNLETRGRLYNCAAALARPIGMYPFPKTYRRHLLDVLKQLRVNCVIDVGAHWGEWGEILRGIGYRGKILSFEPVSASFARLEKAVRKDGNWKAYPFALGDADSNASIHLYKSSVFNSLLPPHEAVQDQFKNDVDEVGIEEIKVRRLDKFLLNLDLGDANTYLKIDTQGYDKNVLMGSTKILDRVVAMQCELPGGRPIYRDEPDLIESLAYCRSLGFIPSGFFPIVRERDGPAVIEFDVVFARSVN